MSINWITLVLALVVAFSIFFGMVRGFYHETRIVVRQLVSILVGIVSIAIAWVVSRQVDSFVLHEKITTQRQWLTHLLVTWQKSPRMATWIVFLICYLILSSILVRVLSLALSAARIPFPRGLSKSRVLGGALGALVGLIRATVLGAVIFLVIQFLSVPAISKMTKSSTPYQLLAAHVYQPWLKPLAARTLPVFAQGALQPIAQNIAIFAVPTSQRGAEVGILAVPTQIADLSHRLTKGVTNPQQKARVLYDWERTHVKYNWAKYDDYVYHHKWDAQTPLETLQTGKGVCADYALLYADLAHASGLTVRIDEGLGGTASDYGSHAWNEVFIPQANRWIFVDTTWGSEQNVWFDVPANQFGKTHVEQTSITISAKTPSV